MITLTIFLCFVATTDCKNITEQASYPSIGECGKEQWVLMGRLTQQKAEIAAMKDALGEHGIEVRGITCRAE